MDDSNEYLWSTGLDEEFICINAENPESGYGRYANDRLTPQHLQGIDNLADNAKIVHDPSISKSKPVILRALREIEAGEEIYVSYGSDYWVVYRGLDRATALKVQECYDLPIIPPHRPEMVMNVQNMEDQEIDGATEEQLPQQYIHLGEDVNVDIVNELLVSGVQHQHQEDDEVNNIPLEGSEVSKVIHTKQVKDLPRSRIDASYHSIVDKSLPEMEYRGIVITKHHDIRIATLNVNGLTRQKPSEILWWIEEETETDVLIAIDTRVTENEWKNITTNVIKYWVLLQ